MAGNASIARHELRLSLYLPPLLNVIQHSGGNVGIRSFSSTLKELGCTSSWVWTRYFAFYFQMLNFLESKKIS
jgi:hypothetical protein